MRECNTNNHMGGFFLKIKDSQLAALKKYRVDLENDLEEHKNYWEPMSKLVFILYN